MDPAPQIVVIQIKQGKEIGGGNHYCIICRAPQSCKSTTPSPLIFHSIHSIITRLTFLFPPYHQIE